MVEITFHPLAETNPEHLLAMLLNPDVRRHMPLASDDWTKERALNWAKGKDAQWQQNGYGPWAIRLDGTFAGWGGFQKEEDEVDLALVLLPQYWGHGVRIFREFVRRGREMRLEKITILLPPSRERLSGLARLGFEPAGEVHYSGQVFHKFRLPSLGRNG